MTKRLETILKLAEPTAGLIDVGTDHGYIPVALAQSGFEGNIIASDINPGPLSSALSAAAAAGVEERITFTMCSGLQQCEPESVDTIVIAGMGGDLIASIIDEAEWITDGIYTLILQPMTKAEVLRYFLINNCFDIIKDITVKENGRLFQIIKARSIPYGFSPVHLSDAELFTGSPEYGDNILLFSEKLEREIYRMEDKCEGMNMSGNPEAGYFNGIHAEMKRIRNGL